METILIKLLFIFFFVFSGDFKRLSKNEKLLIKRCDNRYKFIDRKCDAAYDTIKGNCSTLHQSFSSIIDKTSERIKIRCQQLSEESCLYLKKKFVGQQYQDFIKIESECQTALNKVDETCKPALERVDKLCFSTYETVGCHSNKTFI